MDQESNRRLKNLLDEVESLVQTDDDAKKLVKQRYHKMINSRLV